MPPPAERTFAVLCDRWLEVRTPLKRSKKDDESIIRRHLRPAFGTVLLKDVNVAAVDRFVAGLRHLDPKTVHNILTLLIATLNYARDLEWLHRVPRIRKPKVRPFEADYSYLRSRAEIDRLLAAAAVEGPLVEALYATAVFTGARAGELGGLRWEDVSFDRRIIVIQRSFDGPTKAGDVRYVPIVDALLPILRAWRLRNPMPMVFPNRDGRMLQPSARVFQETFHRVLARAGFPRGLRGKHERAYNLEEDPEERWDELLLSALVV